MKAARNTDLAGWNRLPQRSMSELVSGRTTGALQTCLRVVDLDDPDASADRVRHRHARLEEVIYVERGEAELRLDGQDIPLRAGDAIAVAPMTWHCTVPSAPGVRLICFFPDPAPENDYEEEKS